MAVDSQQDKQKKEEKGCFLPISCTDCHTLSAEFGVDTLSVAIAVLSMLNSEVSDEKIRDFIKNNYL